MTSIFLLTGWGVGSTALIKLTNKLQQLGYQVTLQDLPYLTDSKQWLKAVAKQLPATSYWLGWSLGGQILSQLTQTRAEQCLGLITLASNACFRTTTDWSTAMPVDTFNSFQKNYQQQPEQTLKRFLQLVTQGCPQARAIVKELQQTSNNYSVEQANAGLQLLANLDTRLALQQFTKPQYHLLAENDVLVPKESATALKALLPKAQIELLAQTGHAFPVQDYQLVVNKIDQFIKANV